MMYPFMTLDDGTEIVHSEMREDGTVKVYIEKNYSCNNCSKYDTSNASKWSKCRMETINR